MKPNSSTCAEEDKVPAGISATELVTYPNVSNCAEDDIVPAGTSVRYEPVAPVSVC